MSSTSPAKPPIRVGQLWRDRKGTTHLITGVQLTATHRDGTDFPLRFPVTDDTGCTYTLAGTEWERQHSYNDLIELVCDVSPDASEAAKPPIRVGQSWLTRDNRIAVIESTTDQADSTHPIRACVHNAAGRDACTYTSDGQCFAGLEYPLDLITLVSNVSNDASEAVRPQLHVGQVWRDRNGDLHTIVEDDGTECYPLRDNHGNWFTRSGYNYEADDPDDLDLIELVSDVSDDASDAATPEVRVGQVWRDRNGDLHTIVEDDGTDIWPLRVTNGHWYTRNGKYLGSGHTHTLDLVELVSEAGEAATPATTNAAKPPLCVGQTWRDRTGATHTIIYDDNTQHHPLLCSNQCWYERDGRSIVHDMSPEIELVELVSDVSDDASEATEPAPSTGEAATPFSFRTAARRVADGTWPDAPTAARAASDAAKICVGQVSSAATVFAGPNPDADAAEPYVIAISHGPDVVSRVMSDGSAWYAPTHHGIPTGPWTRYAD